MNRVNPLQRLGLGCSIAVLLSGCLFKSGPVPTRHFVLAPMPGPAHAPATPQPPAVEVGFVQMPAYLLRDALVVRKSPTEFAYLENALWAERLDQCFQRTLADNLGTLLAARRQQLPASDRGKVRVSVEVNQFDVDTQGQGRLSAGWRLTLPGSEHAVKSGLTHLTRPGPSPLANPQAIATTLSALTAQFSQQLAEVLSAATPAQDGQSAVDKATP